MKQNITLEQFLSDFGITPKNKRLYEEAVTHNSFANESHLKYTYQRMEFLGDAVLQMYVSKFLFLNYPKIAEGVLTKHRSNVVREESLAETARGIGLGKIIRLGRGEANSNGHDKDSILSDVFEAFTAAIYLDQGEEVLLKWLKATLFVHISKPGFMDKLKDYKSELQELLQAENRNDLKYTVEHEKYIEKENRIEYTVSVFLTNQKFGTGTGFSKQEAEQNAAKDCLSKMKNK